MCKFISHFESIIEPRIKRCRSHELMDILFLSICAILCNAERWGKIEDFDQTRIDRL